MNLLLLSALEIGRDLLGDWWIPGVSLPGGGGGTAVAFHLGEEAVEAVHGYSY